MASAQWIYSGPEWPSMLLSMPFTTDAAGGATVAVPGAYPVEWIGSSKVQGVVGGTANPYLGLYKGGQNSVKTAVPNPQFPFQCSAEPGAVAEECNFLTTVGNAEQLFGIFTGLAASTAYRWQILVREPKGC